MQMHLNQEMDSARNYWTLTMVRLETRTTTPPSCSLWHPLGLSKHCGRLYSLRAKRQRKPWAGHWWWRAEICDILYASICNMICEPSWGITRCRKKNNPNKKYEPTYVVLTSTCTWSISLILSLPTRSIRLLQEPVPFPSSVWTGFLATM